MGAVNVATVPRKRRATQKSALNPVERSDLTVFLSAKPV
jgi:hypothetical protein